MATKIHGRIRVVMDKNDPDTPVMVYLGHGRNVVSATWYCAFEEGEVEGEYLTDGERKWMESISAEAENFYNAHRVLD